MASLCSVYTEESLIKFSQKLAFFFKFDKIQPLILFLLDFSLSANLVWNLGMVAYFVYSMLR